MKTAKKRGRPAKYRNGAERQKAYNDRRLLMDRYRTVKKLLGEISRIADDNPDTQEKVWAVLRGIERELKWHKVKAANDRQRIVAINEHMKS